MRIPGPLESLSNPDGEVVFFTDAFKHGLRLRAKSADQGGWVQSNCLSTGQRGHFVVGVPSSQKTWHRRRVLVSGAWESSPNVIVERHIPTTFQTVGRPIECRSVALKRPELYCRIVVSLKRPIATKREVEIIERVRSKIAKEERVGLISEAEHARKQKEKEEEQRRKMASGRAMNEATRRRLESQAPKRRRNTTH
ncbi:unnamed protein product [Prunus armeniaca]